MFDAHFPSHLWANSIQTVNYLIILLPSKTTKHCSPYQLLHKRQPEYNHLRVFGCACYPLLPSPTRQKLQPRTTQCVFLGYPPNIKGYKCLHPSSGRIYLSRHVVFDEHCFPYQHISSPPTHSTSTPPTPSLSSLLLTPSSSTYSSTTSNSAILPPTISRPTVSCTSPAHTASMSSPTSPSTQSATQPIPSAPLPPHPMVTRAKTGSLKPKQIFDLYHSTETPSTPTSLGQALKSAHWREAMSQEFNALQHQGTWDLVPPPSSHTILGSRWTFRTKHHANGTIARYKARLVAQGHKQQHGLDYHETFSPVAKLPTIRIFLTVALHHTWPILQFDVSNAFLHGQLTDTMYMHQPPGFKDPQFPNHICLLKKFIYGLKQVPRQWFTTFSSHLLRLGFKFNNSDPSLLTYHHNSQHLYLLIYVDDILITGTSSTLISSIISNLQNIFQIKVLGPINHFLGIYTISTPTGLFLSQAHYAENILSKAGMSSCKPVQNPFPPKPQAPTANFTAPQDLTLYRHLVGALQYLTITRPDIQFVTNTLCQHLHNSTPDNFALLNACSDTSEA